MILGSFELRMVEQPRHPGEKLGIYVISCDIWLKTSVMTFTT